MGNAVGRKIGFAALAILLNVLLFIASRIQVDYFDVFNTLSNAKTIAFGQGPWEIRRFIFPAVLSSPWFWLESELQLDGLGFRAAHLMNILFFALWLYLIFDVYKRRFSPGWALTGICALATTPLLLHYVPSAKEDLLSALLIWAALSFYLRNRWTAAGVFSGLAMASRYNLLVLLSGFFVLHALVNRRSRREPLVVLGTAGATFALIPLLVYPFIRHAALADALPVFGRELYILFLHHATGYQPYYVFFQFLLLVVGVPYLLLASWAVLSKLKNYERDAEFEFHALWVVLNIAYHAFFQWGKEMRYLFPVLPSLFFLAVEGIRCLGLRKLQTACVFFLIAYGSSRAARELLKFQDPFYFTAFERKVSLRAKELAQGGRIFWMGRYYGLHPREAVFHPEDHFTYLYHFHVQVVRFYSGRPVQPLMGGDLVLPEPGEKRKWVSLPGVGEFARDGDVFIVNIDPYNTSTEDITSTLPPLYLQRARIYSSLDGLADGQFEWYGRPDSASPWKFVTKVTLEKGKNRTPLRVAKPKESRFLNYDIVENYGLTPLLLPENEKDGGDYAQSSRQIVPAE